MQRRKGAAGEREVAALLRDSFGLPCARTLGQARDGGGDIAFRPFLIEVKRRRSIGVEAWVKQAQAAAKDGELPVVLARADGGEWMLIAPWSVAERLLRNEMDTPCPGRADDGGGGA